MTHAVEDGIDHGVGADGGLHVCYGAGRARSFHAEEDDVVGAVDFVRRRWSGAGW